MSRRRASSRRLAQEIDYLKQLRMMKQNPPRLKPTRGGWLIEVFSPVIGRYMEMNEWTRLEDAETDKENLDKAHAWTLKRLWGKIREERARASMAALLR